MKFSELALSPVLLRAVAEMGFEEATAIQAKAIPYLLEKQGDLIGLASTGTGKTAAFSLPLLNSIQPELKTTQGLVIAPTRELCLQITEEVKRLAAFMPKLNITPVYGGADIQKQIRSIAKGSQIVVATPGRLRDLIRRKAVDIRSLEVLILDEADEMLNMGFKEEIDDILKHCPPEKRTWLFSATMPPEVRRISDEYMTDPFEIKVGSTNTTNADIDHQVVITRPSERYDILCRYLDYDPKLFGLVFCRTRRDTQELADRLGRDGYDADCLHGDLSQPQRDRVMNKFRSKRLQLLIATDVAARGIDVEEITHVFHFNIPDDRAFYTHRSGRTGRAGRKGISLVLCHPRDKGILKGMDKKLNLKITQAHVPTDREIISKRMVKEMNSWASTNASPELNPILADYQELFAGLSREDLIAKFAAMTAHRLGGRYNLLRPDQERKKKAAKRHMKTQRMFINVGKLEMDDIGHFIAFMVEFGGISGDDLGRIDLGEKHSFFDLNVDMVKRVTNKFKKAELYGRPLRVNLDDGPKRGGGSERKFPKSKKPKRAKKKKARR